MTSPTRTAETAAAPARAAAPGAAAALDALARSAASSDAHARSNARPWWFAAPAVALGCARVAAAPLVAVVRLAEAAVAIALLAALGVAAAWHLGYIADKEVVAALKPVGQRLLAMVQSAGAP
jgi:hypothetical protein